MAEAGINKQDSKAAQAAIKILFDVLPKSARGIHNIAYTFGLISRETGIKADQATDLIMAWSERLRALPNFKELYPQYRKLSLYRYQVRYAVQSAYKRPNDMPSSARFRTLTGKKAPAASFWDKSEELDKSAQQDKAGGQAGPMDAEKEELSAKSALATGRAAAIDGSSYFGPISVLLEKMVKSAGPSEVTSDSTVNGFACSICLLVVASLEAYIRKILSAEKPAKDPADTVPAPDSLERIYPDFPFGKELAEIIMLHNIIARNRLVDNYGEFVDAESGRTKILGLNISPVKVDASDAVKALQAVWNILVFLEKKDSTQCHVSDLSVRYKSKMVKFGKVIGLPETCT